VLLLCVSAGIAFSYDRTAVDGPLAWAKLTPPNPLCGTGQQQSPINIVNPVVDTTLSPLAIDYPPAVNALLTNTGTTLQISFASNQDPQFLFNGPLPYPYQLVSVDFHSPSEHQINNQSYPLEAHFYHQSSQLSTDANSTLEAVIVSVFYTEGNTNAFISQLTSALGNAKVVTSETTIPTLTWDKAYDLTSPYYYYVGSYPTPPCREVAQWFVLDTPQTISSNSLQLITSILPRLSNRPVQQVADRIVRASSASASAVIGSPPQTSVSTTISVNIGNLFA